MDTISNAQATASHDSKIDDMRAELAKFSHDTTQQLAQLCQSVSAIQAKLLNTTATADDAVDTAAAPQVQHRHQRARVSDDHIPILARNEVLDTVFSFVGIGDYYYVACVCRNWRGRYLTLCHNTLNRWTKKACPPYTSCSSIVMTVARLQLALDNGLTVAQLQAADHLALTNAIVNKSLEPMGAITLARLYGLAWNTSLTEYAACFKKYELLKWLRKCGCPWNLDDIMTNARDNAELQDIKDVCAITGPWPIETLSDMMNEVALYDEPETVKWCREQGAEWPKSFYDLEYAPHGNCWPVRCVQWAIANGSTFLEWRCQDLAPHQFLCKLGVDDHSDDASRGHNCFRNIAIELFRWAHENGCPFTCNEAVALAVAAVAV
jgi:hypothetical protein